MMKTKKMFLIFSHALTQQQIKQAKEKFNISEFISLPQNLQQIWSGIDPDIESLKETLEPICEFLKYSAKKDDVVLVQGDFGAVCIVVRFSQENDLLPVYATTKRNVVEYVDKNSQNVKKSIFEFRRFREYGI